MPKTPKPPYLLLDQVRGDIHIWIVDGSYSRTNIDEEFTNFGQHYRYPYIKIDEFWIDRETHPDEKESFIEHLLVEFKLMAKGVPYEKALALADRAERKERRRAGDLLKVTRHGRILPDPKSVCEELWKRLDNGLEVWIVNARRFRSVFDIDFTEGGHDHVYEFIPQGQIWIDDDIDQSEGGFVLLHELYERNHMAKGLAYRDAHRQASNLEFRCRHHPDELHDALVAQGW
ncbi:MAG: hypothetical protein QHH07_03685 [Sedimentisphaerales bacterium]|jgi:hypothetical protein|nr:hypothetical protein [Sedimentisphaerales bacterium]